jgi:hypothetical protein
MMRLYPQRSVRTAVAAAAVITYGATVNAQTPSPWTAASVPNQISVSLIQQDSSDCTNSTVRDDPNRTRGGEVLVTKSPNGTTKVEIGMTVTPNTTYHFFLKCVRELGQIRTDDEGIGLATFEFQTSSAGATFAFDMYPDGAPSGNKFQSMTVTFK